MAALAWLMAASCTRVLASMDACAVDIRLVSRSRRALNDVARSSDCRRTSSDTSFCFASVSFASNSSCACVKSDWTVATCASWVRSSFCNWTRRFSRAASADSSASREAIASCSTCGLLSSRITEAAVTSAPGCSRIRSTRPSVLAGNQRVSSGTSVPRPRTCLTSCPLLTVSMSSVFRSTDGAAGFIRARTVETRATSSRPTMPYKTRRSFLRFRIAGSRATSAMWFER